MLPSGKPKELSKVSRPLLPLHPHSRVTVAAGDAAPSAWRRRDDRGDAVACFPARAVLALLLWLMLLPSAARAEGNFEVRSAYTSRSEGVLFLNAQIDYELPEGAEQALRSGVTLDLEVQVEVDRSRRFLPDRNLASLRQRYTLAYHALSDRYVVRNVNSGDQSSYPSLQSAEDELGDLRDLPIIDESLLSDDATYKVRIRAVLDRQRLPVPISTVASLFDNWRLASKWFIWRLTSAD
jgi:hypothetical protein